MLTHISLDRPQNKWLPLCLIVLKGVTLFVFSQNQIHSLITPSDRLAKCFSSSQRSGLKDEQQWSTMPQRP